MAIPEQALELDLPTILIDSEGKVQGTVPPGLEEWGCLSVPGTLRVGLRLDCPDSDPTRLQVLLRLLEARYEPPADCPPAVLETILNLNSALNDRLLGHPRDDLPRAA